MGFLILDSFICYGPLRKFLLRAFNQRNLRKQEARRFLSQVRGGGSEGTSGAGGRLSGVGSRYS